MGSSACPSCGSVACQLGQDAQGLAVCRHVSQQGQAATDAKTATKGKKRKSAAAAAG